MLTTQEAETLPAARSASHTVPEPLLSSRSRQWNGIVVELRRARDVDLFIPYHDHVISVVLAGVVNLCQCRNGRTSLSTLCSGDVIITALGEPKRWQHVEEAVGIVLRLAPTYVERVAAEECTAHARPLEIQDNFGTRDGRIEEIARQLLTGLELECVSRLYVESLTRQLSLHLLRHYSAFGIAVEKLPATLAQHKLRRAIDYIEAYLHRDPTLSQIATALAMSPGHFAHAFRQTTGLPPHRYVLNRKIERAKALLRDSNLPINEIAQRVGCSSHSYFTVLFHRATGTTPHNYRSGS